MCFNHIHHLNRMLSGCGAEHAFKQRHKWSLLRDHSQRSGDGNVAHRFCTEGKTGLRVQRWVSFEREE